MEGSGDWQEGSAPGFPECLVKQNITQSRPLRRKVEHVSLLNHGAERWFLWLGSLEVVPELRDSLRRPGGSRRGCGKGADPAKLLSQLESSFHLPP